MRITQQRWVILVIVFTGLVFSVGLAPPESPQDRFARIAALWRSIDHGKSLVKDQPAERFVELTFVDLPKHQKSRMYSMLDFTLQADAHPQKQGEWDKLENATAKFFAASQADEDDLIEYRWKYLGQSLRAVAEMDVMRLDVQLDEAKTNPQLDRFGSKELDRVRGLLSAALRLKGIRVPLDTNVYELKIPWPADLADGVSFSSNPEMNLMSADLYYWFARVDGYVHNRTLSLLFYLKPGQLAGYRDGSKWFSDEFRARVQEAAQVKAQQAKAPKPGA